MSETYCGKNCLECGQKEALNCPGCKEGPGKQYSGDCSLAKCCTGKGHQECATCGFSGNCGTLRSKDRMPEYRLKSIEAEKIRAAAIARRAPVLGKWLWILFWLIIPSSVASVLTNENITGTLPVVFMLGEVLAAICSFAYGFILIRLASEEEHYRTAGICALVSGAASVLIACIAGGAKAPAWTLLISVPASIVSLVGTYYEFTAHATVLTGVDIWLPEKWASLWKWHIGMYGAMLGSLLLMILIPILGMLVMIAAAIGVVIVSILKLVYLYRTAKLFREYPVEVM